MKMTTAALIHVTTWLAATGAAYAVYLATIAGRSWPGSVKTAACFALGFVAGFLFGRAARAMTRAWLKPCPPQA